MKLPPVNAKSLQSAGWYIGGMAGIFHETVIQAAERPTFLILFAGMIGLPTVLNKDKVTKESASTQAVSADLPPEQVP